MSRDCSPCFLDSPLSTAMQREKKEKINFEVSVKTIFDELQLEYINWKMHNFLNLYFYFKFYLLVPT